MRADVRSPGAATPPTASEPVGPAPCGATGAERVPECKGGCRSASATRQDAQHACQQPPPCVPESGTQLQRKCVPRLCSLLSWLLRFAVAALAASRLLIALEGIHREPPGVACVHSHALDTGVGTGTGTGGGDVWRPYAEEDAVAGVTVVYQVSEVLERTRSDFQSGEVFVSPFFGKVMLLDNELMLSEHDEAHYHEMLAHVPLTYFPAARRVLIIGGGDGGTLTQVLKHQNVEHVTMVELDPMVVRMSRDHFPHLAAAFSDPRVTLTFADGGAWVRERVAAVRCRACCEGSGDGTCGAPEGHTVDGDSACGDALTPEAESGSTGGCDCDCRDWDGDADPDAASTFDVVLLDTTDFGHASTLFQSTFYQEVRDLLAPTGGAVAFNVDSPAWAPHVVQSVCAQMARIFKHSALYQTWQPTYASGHYAFMFASDTVHPLRTQIDWAAVKRKLSSHPPLQALRYWNPDVHVGSFLLPTFVAATGASPARQGSLADYMDANGDSQA